jgi:hypothetical protein
MAEIRQVTIKVRDRQVDGGAVPSSAVFGEPFVNIYNGALRFSGVTGGDFEESSQSGVFEVGSKLFNSSISNRLNINSNFVISGDTGIVSTYGGTSGAGLVGKFMSGITGGFVLGDISDIQGVTTRVQPGTNIITGGTPNFPTVNLVDSPSINGLTASGTSNFTGIIQSGGTNLEDIFLTAGDISGTSVSAGSNVSINNVGTDYEVSVVDSPSFNDITFSGTATGGNASFADMSATTLYSGSTDMDTVIRDIAGEVSGVHTQVQGGTNVFTGGTALLPVINMVDSPSFNNILFSGTATGGNASFVDMSATTLYSGSTDVDTIIRDIAAEVSGEHTYIAGGTNIVTGGTPSLPTISLVDSPSVDVLTASGHVLTNGTTYSGGTVIDDGVFTIDAATQVEIDSDLLPTAHLTFDLGAPGQRWDELYARKVRLGTSSTTLEDGLFSSTTGTFLFDFADDLFIDNNVHPQNDISYDLGKLGNRWSTVFAQDLDLAGEMSVTGFTDTSLTAGRVIYAGVGGKLTDEAGFEYDETENLFKTGNLQVGNPGDTGTTTTIFGDILVIGESISGFTSELYIEDNLIELNYNPTASTISTSLGAGWSIQDGSGSAGTDVLWDIRGAAAGLANRSFATNLQDIRIRETGTISSPNGDRVIAETDCIDGGTY